MAAVLGAEDVVDDDDMLRKAREGAGGKGREGASEGRRKASVVQSCEPPESREEKLQEY